jgi:signal peptidase II
MTTAAGHPVATEARRWSMPATSALVGVLVVAADQLSKTWALRHLEGRSARPVFWTLRLNFSLNSGVAFSLARGAGALVTPIAAAVVVLVVLMTRSLTGRTAGVAVGLVVGGSVGNLVDRLLRSHGGAVIDFIDFQWWPIFNLADAGIVVGGLLLALAVARHPDR